MKARWLDAGWLGSVLKTPVKVLYTPATGIYNPPLLY
jgi:hypothetical protein